MVLSVIGLLINNVKQKNVQMPHKSIIIKIAQGGWQTVLVKSQVVVLKDQSNVVKFMIHNHVIMIGTIRDASLILLTINVKT